jgi:Predicted membrane protein (DUF2079)
VIATSPRLALVEEGLPTIQPASSSSRHLQLVWRAALALLCLQLAGMLMFSTVQYQRFNLTDDFAAYSQAWTAIAHGHLDPTGTIWAFPFWRNDLELLMWPLALFYWVYPHTLGLLWLQDFAVVGGELVAILWAREIVTNSPKVKRESPWFLAVVTALVIITPWSWFTVGFDFHFEAFAALFGLLAARDIWRGRYRRLIIWVPLALASCAAAGAILIMAVGFTAIFTRGKSRSIPLVLALVAAGWLALAAGIGAMRFGGIPLSSMYGYLLGRSGGHVGFSDIIGGLFVNPLGAVRMLGSHLNYVAGYVAGGVIGLWSRWGLVPVVLVVVPSAVNADTYFIHYGQAFQSWPAVLFVMVGVAMALSRLAKEGTSARRRVPILVCCTLALAAGVAAVYAGPLSLYIDRVNPTMARELAQVKRRIPGRAEVVVSQGVIGRFAAGRVAYPYWAEGEPESYVVTRHAIIFVLATDLGPGDGQAAEARQAITYVETRLHATVLLHGAGIWEFKWSPKVGTTSVVLP